MYLFLNCELGPSENIQTRVMFGLFSLHKVVDNFVRKHGNRCFVVLQIN